MANSCRIAVPAVLLASLLFAPAALLANQVDVHKYATLNDAVAANSTAQATLVVSSPTTLKNDVVIPSNLALAVLYGGEIVNGPHSVVIKGIFTAGLHQSFRGDGKVTFGLSSTPDIYPQWWGATGNGKTDDSKAFMLADRAVGDSGQVRIPSGRYFLSRASESRSTWVLDSHAEITGPGGRNTHHRIFKVGNGGLWGGGTKVGSTSNWLQTELNSIAGRTSEDAAEFIVLSHSGNIGGVFGTRTSDNALPKGAQGAISQALFAINDNTSSPQTIYALYGDAIRNQGTGTTHFMEGDIVNRGSIVDISPNTPFSPGATNNLWVASGGQVPDAKDASSAIGIINNGAKFRKGIVFHQTALSGADGKTGLGEAISFGKGHYLQWYNVSGNNTAAIIGNVETAAKGTKILFNDNGYNIVSVSGDTLFNVPSQAQKIANHPELVPSAYGSPVEIRAAGNDHNIGVDIKTKGKGLIGFYTDSQQVSPSAGNAGKLPASPAGYMKVHVNGIERLIPYY